MINDILFALFGDPNICSAAYGAGVWNYVVQAVVVIASLLFAKQRQEAAEKKLQNALDKLNQDAAQGIKANTRVSNKTLPVIYGKHRVGANDVYVNTKGVDDKYLYFVHAISEGKLLDTVTADNDQFIALDGDGNPYIWFNGMQLGTEEAERFEGYYEYDIKPGSSTQTVSTLISDDIPAFNRRYKYTAYVAWKLAYDEDAFASVGKPEIQYLVYGTKVLDIRPASPTYNTYIWSDNPALCLYDFMINSRYGPYISTSELDIQSFQEVATYCDDNDLTVNYVVYANESANWDVIENIMKLFRGTMTTYDSKYYLHFADANEEVVQKTLDDSYILQDSEGNAQIQFSDQGPYQKPNGLRVTYITDINNAYTDTSFIIGEEDGLVQDFNLYGVTNEAMAGKLALYELERRRLNRTISGTFRDNCIDLEPSDLVYFTYSESGIASQLMRITASSITNDGFVQLVMQYEDESLYDQIYNSEADDIYTTILPNINTLPYISNLQAVEEIYIERNRSFSRLLISYEIPDDYPWFKEMEIYISNTTNDVAEYKPHGKTSSRNSFVITKVEEGKTYYIKLVAVTVSGAKDTLVNAPAVVQIITGVSQTRPDSITKLTGTGGPGRVNLYADKLDVEDIEIYEFRYSPSATGSETWDAAILLDESKRGPQLEYSNFKPGVFTFWCNTKGYNGLYGENPRSCVVRVFEQKDYTYLTSRIDNYSDSTNVGDFGVRYFENTEHDVVVSDDVLEVSNEYWCSDGTSVFVCDSTDAGSYIRLDGVYESRTFDLTTDDEYYLYIDFDIGSTGTDITWQGIFNGYTWQECDVGTKTWLQLFDLESVPTILNMSIYYKTNIGDDWSVAEEMHIKSAVVQARYFKIRIEMENPNPSVLLRIYTSTLKFYT